jgi:hypothetical protein
MYFQIVPESNDQQKNFTACFLTKGKQQRDGGRYQFLRVCGKRGRACTA